MIKVKQGGAPCNRNAQAIIKQPAARYDWGWRMDPPDKILTMTVPIVEAENGGNSFILFFYNHV